MRAACRSSQLCADHVERILDSGDTILNSAVSDLVSSVGAIFPREIQVDL